MRCYACQMRPANPLREDGQCDECGWWWEYYNALSSEDKAVGLASPVPFAVRATAER